MIKKIKMENIQNEISGYVGNIAGKLNNEVAYRIADNIKRPYFKDPFQPIHILIKGNIVLTIDLNLMNPINQYKR